MPLEQDFTLRPAAAADAEELFAIHRGAMGQYVKLTWGWDEDYQRERFLAQFLPEALSVVMVGGKPVGFLNVYESDDEIDLRAIELDLPYQCLGIGTRVLGILVERAQSQGKAPKPDSDNEHVRKIG